MSLRGLSIAAAGGLLLLGATASRGAARPAPPRPAAAVTAALGPEQVRFVAPGSVYQMRLQVFDAADSKVYDSDYRFGNVLDWRPARGAAMLVDGWFVCVVSVRDISGAVAEHRGRLGLEGGTARSLAPAEARRAAGALPPGDVAVEPREPLAAARPGAGLATTLLAHDGGGGLLASGAGGLSFRLGDYLAGEDVERMRLTEQGNLGIGVRNPRARLDVAGVIHTSEGIRFPDGTLQTTAAVGRAPASAGAASLTPVSSALVDGSGTPNVLAKWTTGTNIGDSAVVEVGGNLGVGTASPAGAFDLQRGSPGDVLQRFWNTSTGGAKLRYVAGNGATSQIQLTDIDEWLASIAGNQTAGLQFRVRGTGPGDNSETGLANSTRMTITREGKVGIGVTSPVADVEVRRGTGLAGDGAFVQIGGTGANGDAKYINFGDYLPTGAGVSIGESEEDNQMVLLAQKFRFDGGALFPGSDAMQNLGTTDNRWNTVFAFNGTIQTSDARQKRAITDLRYGLREVLQLRPVTYQWRYRPDREHLGLIAQEVQRVLPEVVVAGTDAAATLGMSYTDLVPLVIKAIQELAADNAALRARIAVLESGAAAQPPADGR
jgi:hypothetical protein